MTEYEVRGVIELIEKNIVLFNSVLFHSVSELVTFLVQFAVAPFVLG